MLPVQKGFSGNCLSKRQVEKVLAKSKTVKNHHILCPLPPLARQVAVAASQNFKNKMPDQNINSKTSACPDSATQLH